MQQSLNYLQNIFPVCNRAVSAETWLEILDALPPDLDYKNFPDLLAENLNRFPVPGYLADLAAVEMLLNAKKNKNFAFEEPPEKLITNPTLSLIKLTWQGLPALIHNNTSAVSEPVPGTEYILVWKEPRQKRLLVKSATPQDLLALKIVTENLNKHDLARHEDTTLAVLDNAIEQAASKGIVLKPPSLLSRNISVFNSEEVIPEQFIYTNVFTLQCHITQTCDLRCKHCYDRSSRTNLNLEDAQRVFDQMYDFCQARNVYGQVSLSGGNPLLHPHFFDIYQAAADRGFMTAILGNPTTPEILSRIKDIQQPEFFQVSLEGLQEHNDFIRGAGFFDRALHFLDDLQAAGIYSMVMLTLTRDNIDQVLPLAEILRDKVDLFTFNRLSMVGEGARLLTPDKNTYKAFLQNYLQAKQENPAMALKDNLINIIHSQEGNELFGGCAGFGCGAAFNFVALLPDGEVHACRKFNSPIGNILSQSLTEIYDSPEADIYRTGPSDCIGCRIRHVCGGCLAVIDSQGLDIKVNRDPCCFLEDN